MNWKSSHEPIQLHLPARLVIITDEKEVTRLQDKIPACWAFLNNVSRIDKAVL